MVVILYTVNLGWHQRIRQDLVKRIVRVEGRKAECVELYFKIDIIGHFKYIFRQAHAILNYLGVIHCLHIYINKTDHVYILHDDGNPYKI